MAGLLKVFSDQNDPVVPLAPHQTQVGLEFWHFWCVTGPWARGVGGTGDIKPSPPPPAPGEPPQTQPKFPRQQKDQDGLIPECMNSGFLSLFFYSYKSSGET